MRRFEVKCVYKGHSRKITVYAEGHVAAYEKVKREYGVDVSIIYSIREM